MAKAERKPIKKSPKQKRWTIGAAVVAITAVAAGAAALLSNTDQIIENLTTKCIAFSLCSPSDHFVSARVTLVNPNDGTVPSIFGAAFPSEILSDYSAISIRRPLFEGIEYVPSVGGPNETTIDAKPLQAPEHYFFGPEGSFFEWRIGFPILDLLIGANSPINITDTELYISRSELDQTPYVQVVNNDDDFSTITLVNESTFPTVQSNLEFSIADDSWKAQQTNRRGEQKTNRELCKELIASKKLDVSDLRFKTKPVEISDERKIDLREKLRQVVPDLDYRAFQRSYYLNGDTLEKARKHGFSGKEPAGFKDWEKSHPVLEGNDNRSDKLLVFGRVISSSENNHHETLFCNFLTIGPPVDKGAGPFEPKIEKQVKLEIRPTPYILRFDTVARLEPAKPYFRGFLSLRRSRVHLLTLLFG
jgi:hypothetical protein